MVVTRQDVLYCGACGMPPEYCEYGPDFETHCRPWLKKNHPVLYTQLHSNRAAAPTSTEGGVGGGEGDSEAVAPPTEPWTTEERLKAFYKEYMPEKLDNVPALLEKYAGKEEKLFGALTKKYGPEPEDPYVTARWGEDDDDDEGDDDAVAEEMGELDIKDKKKKRRGVSAKKEAKVDTRIVIQKISRNKKKAVTIVIGLDTAPDVNLKDASKAFSKRFAGSSSVKDTPQGTKEIIIQGDHLEDVAKMIVDKFKVAPDEVFLHVDGDFVPFNEF